MRVAVLIAMLALAGCNSFRSGLWDGSPSPIGQMMAADARGEVTCVRMGVLVKGRAACARR